MNFKEIFHFMMIKFLHHSVTIDQVQAIAKVQVMFSSLGSNQYDSILKVFVDEMLLNEYLGIE